MIVNILQAHRKVKENMKHMVNFFQICNISVRYGKCSMKMRTQFILIAEENYVLGTFYIFAIDLLRKSVPQMTVTQ